jgi:hypothetical protein
MKKIHVFISLVLLLLLAPAVLAAGSTGPVTASDAVYQAHVTSVISNPEVFFPGETGTVTVVLTNDGNQSISLTHPNLLSNNIRVLNSDTYTTVIHLGPGSTMTYLFQISPNALDGTYFPIFTVSTIEAGSISYPFQLEVDSKNLSAGISDKPDNFSLGTKDTVNLTVVNPRNGPLDTILITPTGNGLDITPSQKFISSLAAGSSQDVVFQVTPHQESDLTFHITYQNGNNNHATDLVLPLNLGENKLAAVPVINNVAITSTGTSYEITGDVNNAGITDAKSVVLTVVSPARPVEPYAEYAIGSLASDDFSSFTLTFASNDLSTVPLKIQWKDADGNTFSTVKNLDLRTLSSSSTTSRSYSTGSSTGTSGSSTVRTSTAGAGGPPGGGSIFGFGGSRGGGIGSFYPVIVLGIVVIAGIVVWIKRKWIMARIKKR